MELNKGADISAIRNYSHVACHKNTDFIMKNYEEFCLKELSSEWVSPTIEIVKQFDEYLLPTPKIEEDKQ